MIIEGLTGLATWLIGNIFELFQIVNIPTNLVATLLQFQQYGCWVLGADLYNIVISTIIGWLVFKLAAGTILFIWRLLPFT